MQRNGRRGRNVRVAGRVGTGTAAELAKRMHCKGGGAREAREHTGAQLVRDTKAEVRTIREEKEAEALEEREQVLEYLC